MVLIIRKLISAIAAVVLALNICTCAWADNAPYVSASSAVVLHSGGDVIYQKNAESRMLIASTTKIMTAIVVIENSRLDEALEIEPECCGIEGSSMYLEPGQRYTVRELLCGLLLVSGNDAAAALALHTAGSIERFVAMMNSKAQELGMDGSHFANPHGLNAEGHFSTAKDLAYLMDYCMKNSDFAAICGLGSCTVGQQTLVNHNKLLRLYPGCIGGKTGYTQAAGRCLVSCCEREGTRFICVSLSAPDDWNDHQKLYDWAFSSYADRDVTGQMSFEVPVVSGTRDVVCLVPEKLVLFLPKSAQLELEAEMPWFVFAPVNAGDVGGKVSVKLNGEKIGETRLVYESSIQAASRVNLMENKLEQS